VPRGLFLTLSPFHPFTLSPSHILSPVPRRRQVLLRSLTICVAFACAVCGRRQEYALADLVARFPEARKQPGTAFTVTDVTIDGVSRRSVVARGQTRLTYHVTLPKHGRLRVSAALDPSAWSRAGDGVLFLVGVSDGHTYRTAESFVLNPFTDARARHWREVDVNLEEFAGLTVDVILNTRAGLAAGADLQNDVAVWGAPAVLVR